MAMAPATFDTRTIPRAGDLKPALDARAWAEHLLRRLSPVPSEPDRALIEQALAAAGPPAGECVTVRWGTGRDKRTSSGVVEGRYTSGFVAAGKHRWFLSYVDLWARHAFLDAPDEAHLRLNAVLQLLYARMPKPGSGVTLDAQGWRR